MLATVLMQLEASRLDRSMDRGAIINEIKATAAGFQKIDFVYESRNSNVDAHGLAKNSPFDAIGRHVWLIDPPHGVCKTLAIAS